MYRLMISEYQIFAIDEEYQICQVFYNLDKAQKYVKKENSKNELSEEESYLLEMSGRMDYTDKYDFNPNGCGWLR